MLMEALLEQSTFSKKKCSSQEFQTLNDRLRESSSMSSNEDLVINDWNPVK